MSLSKREHKYRAKLFAEWHCKKAEQRFLDNAINSGQYQWESIYWTYRQGWYSTLLAALSFKRLHTIMRQSAYTLEEAGGALSAAIYGGYNK